MWKGSELSNQAIKGEKLGRKFCLALGNFWVMDRLSVGQAPHHRDAFWGLALTVAFTVFLLSFPFLTLSSFLERKSHFSPSRLHWHSEFHVCISVAKSVFSYIVSISMSDATYPQNKLIMTPPEMSAFCTQQMQLTTLILCFLTQLRSNPLQRPIPSLSMHLLQVFPPPV